MRKTVFVCLVGVLFGYWLHGPVASSGLPKEEHRDFSYVQKAQEYFEAKYDGKYNLRLYLNITKDVPSSISNEQLLDAVFQTCLSKYLDDDQGVQLRYKGKAVGAFSSFAIEKGLGSHYVMVYDEGTGPRKYYLPDSPAQTIARSTAPLNAKGEPHIPPGFTSTVDEVAKMWRTGVVPQ